MNSFVLGLIAFCIIRCIILKVNVFDEFIEGVKEGAKMVWVIFPNLMAFCLWTTCFQYCGILEVLQKVLLNFFKVPVEIITMMLLKPFSSQASLSVLVNVFNKYGVDSPYGLLGSIIQTGSDTTFYVVNLYFSTVKVISYRYALKLGLWLDTLSCLLALLIFYFCFI